MSAAGSSAINGAQGLPVPDVDETSDITPTPSDISIKARASADSPAHDYTDGTRSSVPVSQPVPPSPPPVAGGEKSDSLQELSMPEPEPSNFPLTPSDLTPNRPAPPSPALSRRVSQAPSTMSTTSTSSPQRATTSLSRANSLRSRKSTRFSTQQLQMQLAASPRASGGSPLASPSRAAFGDISGSSSGGGGGASKRASSGLALSAGAGAGAGAGAAPPPPNTAVAIGGRGSVDVDVGATSASSTSTTTSTATLVSTTTSTTTTAAAAAAASQARTQAQPQTPAHPLPKKLIKIQDYAFERGDARFEGRGAQVPRANRVKVLTRRLMAAFNGGGGCGMMMPFGVDEEGYVVFGGAEAEAEGEGEGEGGKKVKGGESERRRRRREREEEEERRENEREAERNALVNSGGGGGREGKRASVSSSSAWGSKKKRGKGGLGRLSWGWSSAGEGDGYEDDDSDEWSDSGDEKSSSRANGNGDAYGSEDGPSSWDILRRLSTWRSNFGHSGKAGNGGAGVGGGMNGSPYGSESPPTLGDLNRNFTAAGAADEEEDGDEEDGDYHDAVENYDEDEGGEGEYGDEEEESLYPGLYRAMYAFEPEGTAEMQLVEDQIVRVVGRGGGVGWAVVVCEDADAVGEGEQKKVKHALVPESYLEVVQLDEELIGDGEGETAGSA